MRNWLLTPRNLDFPPRTMQPFPGDQFPGAPEGGPAFAPGVPPSFNLSLPLSGRIQSIERSTGSQGPERVTIQTLQFNPQQPTAEAAEAGPPLVPLTAQPFVPLVPVFPVPQPGPREPIRLGRQPEPIPQPVPVLSPQEGARPIGPVPVLDQTARISISRGTEIAQERLSRTIPVLDQGEKPLPQARAQPERGPLPEEVQRPEGAHFVDPPGQLIFEPGTAPVESTGAG